MGWYAIKINCYIGRKCQYWPMWSNTDLQATSITVEWIVLLKSYFVWFSLVSLFYWELFTESPLMCTMIGRKTTNHGPLSAHLLYYCICTRSSKKQNFPFWHQRSNTESWLLMKQATNPCGTLHMRIVIPWETLRTWGPKILLQAF